MGDDRVRAARLRTICVEAELALGDIQQARADADELAALTVDHALPVLRARSALARGRVAEASGETAAAAVAYQAGLRVLADNGWPLIRAELHLALARLLADGDPPAAITEARAAHLIYDRLGSPLADASARAAQHARRARHRPSAPRRRHRRAQPPRVGGARPAPRRRSATPTSPPASTTPCAPSSTT